MQEEKKNIVRKIKLDLYEIILKDDGILYIYVSGKREETIEDIKLEIKTIGELLNHKKVPMFFRHEEFALPNNEVRNYWAQKDTNPYSKAESFITTNLAQKIIGNFYMKLQKPTRPTQLFTNEKDAIEWLKTFL